MRQPWDPGFDEVIETWWTQLNDYQCLTVDLYPGHIPLKDWAQQQDQDRLWFYPLDDWEEEDMRQFLVLAQGLPGVDQVHVSTALYITSQVSEDLLHDVEIPGVWLVRVQKT